LPKLPYARADRDHRRRNPDHAFVVRTNLSGRCQGNVPVRHSVISTTLSQRGGTRRRPGGLDGRCPSPTWLRPAVRWGDCLGGQTEAQPAGPRTWRHSPALPKSLAGCRRSPRSWCSARHKVGGLDHQTRPTSISSPGGLLIGRVLPFRAGRCDSGCGSRPVAGSRRRPRRVGRPARPTRRSGRPADPGTPRSPPEWPDSPPSRSPAPVRR
jgi:hypothetical protein